MPAYATRQREPTHEPTSYEMRLVQPAQHELGPAIEHLIAGVIDRIATAVADRLAEHDNQPADEWFDSRTAADYLGLHRDSLRRLAAEGAIPTEQEGPGCKLHFRRSALDEWRRAGGRAAHLAAVVDARKAA